jgi:hypothetical protein
LIDRDDTSPHTARASLQNLARDSFEQLPHPPTSPDLAPLISLCLNAASRLVDKQYETQDELWAQIKGIAG